MSDAACTPIQECAAAIHRGGVVLYPTEGVWGLGCDPRNQDAVNRVLELKGRDVAKGLILIAADSDQLDAWVDWMALDKLQRDEVNATWPGFHTWILPCKPDTPRWLRGEHETIAVRVTQHPTVIALCDAVGSAIVSTSANLSGQASPFALGDVADSILRGVDAVCQGETGGAKSASTIHDAVTGDLLRD